jgi:hypothetical protein
LMLTEARANREAAISQCTILRRLVGCLIAQ